MTALLDRIRAFLAGRYDIERELGAGGMATVYLAQDVRHDRKVAVKVLRSELAESLGADRFLREIRISARLEHPHILTLIDSGEAPASNGQPGILYYVMPFVDGESLRERMTRERQLPIGDALRLAAQVADALGYAHDRGVVHRDIKPENILLSGEHTKVTDFGIARAADSTDSGLTATGLVVGTPAYMSPEQIAGDRELDGRSDLYSLACVLFEMLAGHPPFSGANSQSLMVKRFQEEAPRVTASRSIVPPMVDLLLARALSRDPQDRHTSVREFGKALVAEISAPRTIELAETTGRHDTLKRTPFVGREKELAEVRAMIAQLATGKGGMVLIGGEPGVGKTRLCETLMHEARAARALCLVGHCYEMEGTPPYNPFAEILEYASRVLPARTFRDVLGDAAPEMARILPGLRQTFPDISPAVDLPPEQQRQYLFARYREVNQRASRVAPIVVLFDDLHWADESSLQMLSHAATYLAEMPILALGTYRDVELEVNRPFARTLEHLTRQRLAHRIALRRLPEDRTGDLLAALGGAAPPQQLVKVIYHETEGNPFFVEEVFHHLAEEGRLFDVNGKWRSNLKVEELDVPEGVRLVIGRRLERLSESCRSVLTSAAVIGPRFQVSVLEALGDVDTDTLLDTLDEGVRARLISELNAGRETVYAFAHELIRQTLIGTLSLPRRQRRHLKVADAMERVWRDRVEEHASDLAQHLYQAGAAADTEKAQHFLIVAAKQALASAAFEEALLHCDRALSIDEHPAPAREAELRQMRGAALRGVGRWHDAEKEWRSAVTLYERAGDRVKASELSYEHAFSVSWTGRADLALEIAAHGLAMAGEEDSVRRARLLSISGYSRAMVGDLAGGVSALEEARSIGERLSNKMLIANHRSWSAFVAWHYMQFTDTVHHGLAAARSLRELGERWELSAVLGYPQLALFWMGRFADAEELAPELASLSRDLGNVGTTVFEEATRGYLDFARSGDLDALKEFGKHIEESWARTAGPWGQMGLTFRSLAEFWKGDWDTAVPLAERGARDFPAGYWVDWLRGTVFYIQAYLGMPSAMETFNTHRHAIPKRGEPGFIGSRFFVLFSVEGLAMLDQRDEAALLYEVVKDILADGFVVAINGLGETTAGIAAACGERWEDAERHFATAQQQAETLPVRLSQPENRRWHAWMLLSRNAAGDREKAKALLVEAIEGYREMGMPKHVAIAEGLL